MIIINPFLFWDGFLFCPESSLLSGNLNFYSANISYQCIFVKNNTVKRIIILMLLMSLNIQAQTQRFIYEMQFRMDSLKENYEKISFALDVNPKDVKFYEFSYLKADSINKSRGNYEKN